MKKTLPAAAMLCASLLTVSCGKTQEAETQFMAKTADGGADVMWFAGFPAHKTAQVKNPHIRGKSPTCWARTRVSPEFLQRFEAGSTSDKELADALIAGGKFKVLNSHVAFCEDLDPATRTLLGGKGMCEAMVPEAQPEKQQLHFWGALATSLVGAIFPKKDPQVAAAEQKTKQTEIETNGKVKVAEVDAGVQNNKTNKSFDFASLFMGSLGGARNSCGGGIGAIFSMMVSDEACSVTKSLFPGLFGFPGFGLTANRDARLPGAAEVGGSSGNASPDAKSTASSFEPEKGYSPGTQAYPEIGQNKMLLLEAVLARAGRRGKSKDLPACEDVLGVSR